jgi:hypothetical protein
MSILFDFSYFSLNFSIIFLVAVLLFCCLDDRDLVYQVLLIWTGIFCFFAMPLEIQLLITVMILWRLNR